MGQRRKYEDTKMVEEQPFSLAVHSISKLDDPRRHNPKHPGGAAAGVKLSLLTEFATGDWSWKPRRNAQFSQFQMPAFSGISSGATEVLAQQRQTQGDAGALRYSV